MKAVDQVPLEQKIVYASLITILALVTYGVIHNVIINTKPYVFITILVALIFYATMYFLLNFKKILKPLILPIIIFTYLLLIMLWLLTGGNYSTIPLVFPLCMLGVITIADPKYRLGVTILFIITAIVLSCLNYIFNDPVVSSPTEETINAIPAIFIISLIGTAFIAHSLKYNFDMERKAIQEQNHELAEKNKIISEQNEEINQINHTLDQKVQERTRLLEEQNRQLIQYAFYNAHKVRGPLCRILGLVQLAKHQYETDTDFIISKIEESAKELELMTKAINDILQDKKFEN